MPWIRVTDWRTFQHYKDRSPPWIKLHREQILDNRAYRALPDGAQALLVDLWLLASEGDGKVKDDLRNLEFRLRRPRDEIAANLQKLADAGLVQWKDGNASGLLPDASADMLAPASDLQTRGEERRAEEIRGSPQLRELRDDLGRVLRGEDPPGPRLRKA